MKTVTRLMENARIAVTFSTAMLLFFCLLVTKTWASWEIEKKFRADVVVFSFQEQNTLDSYKSYLKGIGGRNAKLGTTCRDDVRNFEVAMHLRTEGAKYHVKVEVKPSGSDSLTEPKTYDLDLSDLKARSIELARNEDGRVYVLNLNPYVNIIDNRPRPADAKDFQIEKWTFSQCPVVVNESQYVGKMSVARGELAWMDIPGVAKFVFALVPFREAKPLGFLKDGHIRIIAEDGTTVDVSDVKNGIPPVRLLGGPYEVWVRWSPPTVSLSQEELSDLLQSLSTEQTKKALEKLAEVGLDIIPEHLEGIKAMMRDGRRVSFVSSGVYGLRLQDGIE